MSIISPTNYTVLSLLKGLKMSHDFSQYYLKLDYKSIVSSWYAPMIPYDLSYDYCKLITKSDLRKLNFIVSSSYNVS